MHVHACVGTSRHVPLLQCQCCVPRMCGMAAWSQEVTPSSPTWRTDFEGLVFENSKMTVVPLMKIKAEVPVVPTLGVCPTSFASRCSPHTLGPVFWLFKTRAPSHPLCSGRREAQTVQAQLLAQEGPHGCLGRSQRGGISPGIASKAQWTPCCSPSFTQVPGGGARGGGARVCRGSRPSAIARLSGAPEGSRAAGGCHSSSHLARWQHQRGNARPLVCGKDMRAQVPAPR